MEDDGNEFDWDFNWPAGNKILDGDDDEGQLWISEEAFILDVAEMEKNKIGAVVSAIHCTLPQTLRDKVKQLMIPINDADSQPIRHIFDEVFDFIEEQRKVTNVVVHCFAGVSRSVALSIAYIMRKFGYGFEASLALVSSKRKCASPNHGFQNQLRKYEKQLEHLQQSNKQQEKELNKEK